MNTCFSHFTSASKFTTRDSRMVHASELIRSSNNIYRPTKYQLTPNNRILLPKDFSKVLRRSVRNSLANPMSTCWRGLASQPLAHLDVGSILRPLDSHSCRGAETSVAPLARASSRRNTFERSATEDDTAELYSSTTTPRPAPSLVLESRYLPTYQRWAHGAAGVTEQHFPRRIKLDFPAGPPAECAGKINPRHTAPNRNTFARRANAGKRSPQCDWRE